jgi:DNA-binding NarL/FixJ family response regulator
MNMYQLLIVGKSLYAEALGRMLANQESLTVIGIAPTTEVAIELLRTEHPDAVIMAGAGETAQAAVGPLLSEYPDLIIFSANLDANHVQVITSERIDARLSELLAAITASPKRI